MPFTKRRAANSFKMSHVLTMPSAVVSIDLFSAASSHITRDARESLVRAYWRW